LLKKRNPQDRPDWSPGVVVVQQFVPVYGARDWWAEKAKDKDFTAQWAAPPGGSTADLYTVPDGKLLLIAEVHKTSRIDGLMALRAYTAEYSRYLSQAAVSVGSAIAMFFSKPKRVKAGETLEAYAYNVGAEDRVAFTIGGWEIEVG